MGLEREQHQHPLPKAQAPPASNQGQILPRPTCQPQPVCGAVLNCVALTSDRRLCAAPAAARLGLPPDPRSFPLGTGGFGLHLPMPRTPAGPTQDGKDGIVLGADTRATEGMVVADKNCSKIHFISPNIYCCGAGTAADTDMTTQLISSNLELHSLSTGRLPRVVTANRMLKQMLFRYQGYIGAALVLGGVDVTGPQLYSIYPHGSTDKLPYVTMGSGSLAAMAVFEDKYKPDMEEEEAKQLVRDAIAAGIYNDLGSGSNIDICVISKNKLDFLRPYDVANRKGDRYGRYKCEKGTTAVLTENVALLEIEVVDETVQTMDTS
uniref:proteasome endopeptidase complex n=2 Tax=Strigidae TaxID=30459 RepID=A0A8C8A5Q2_9STRI